MKTNIITLKIKYAVQTDYEYDQVISCIKNYNNVLRFTYNRVQDGVKSTKDLTKLQGNLNNIFIDSHFLNSAIFEAKSFQKSKLIFGGKKLFIDRCKNKISKEEFKVKKLLPIYSVGEAGKKGNRKFTILSEDVILFKPNKFTHINLNLLNQGINYKKKLRKLLSLQESKQISITYRLDLNYIYLSFDNSIIEQNIYKTIKNRVISLDLNPNYIGYSIVDWKDNLKYNIIDKEIFDLSKLNNQKTNKKDYEIIKVAYKLFEICKHYRCEIFSIEKLTVKSQDLGKGRKLNKLINNDWNRNKLINTLKKLINSSSTAFVQVKPEYSSILGNLIYREERLPDMILSSIEIGRRGIEFQNQYLLNIKIHKKNIIFPELEFVKDKIEKSLEELAHFIKFETYEELFSELKKSKLKYRFLLDNIEKSRVFSKFYIKTRITSYKFI